MSKKRAPLGQEIETPCNRCHGSGIWGKVGGTEIGCPDCKETGIVVKVWMGNFYTEKKEKE